MLRFVQWALLSATLMLCAAEAHALSQIYPPSGWSAGRIYVGMAWNGDIWVVYQDGLWDDGSTPVCAWTQIGVSGALYDRTRIHGSSLGDEVFVFGEPFARTACNSSLEGMPHGVKLEVYTWAGIDHVLATGKFTNLQVYLGSGNDFAVVGGAYLMSGEGGDDKLIAYDDTSVSMYGGAGYSNLFCAYDSPISLMDGGGAPADARWGYASSMPGIENVATEYDCDFFRDYVNDTMLD